LVRWDRHRCHVGNQDFADNIEVRYILRQLHNQGLLQDYRLLLLGIRLEHATKCEFATGQARNRVLCVLDVHNRGLFLIRDIHNFVVRLLECLERVNFSLDPVGNVDEGVLKLLSEAFNLLLKVVVSGPRDQLNVSEFAN